MSFSDCPLVVLDQIFGQLEVAELRAISLTCKSLHPCANCFLYRKADDFVTEQDKKWHPWFPRAYLRNVPPKFDGSRDLISPVWSGSVVDLPVSKIQHLKEQSQYFWRG